jgi:prevent-host-death family protein
MLKAVNATEGKNNFLQLLDKCKENSFLITRNGKPVAVLIDSDEYERIMETLKIYLNPEIKEKIEEWQKK